MKQYRIVYLPTGRSERDHKGNVILISATSERGAKQRVTRGLGYRNWDMYAMVEDV